MKNYILIIIMTFLLWSCKSDNFYETERFIQTDKESYQIGDEFELTIFIIPEKDEKEIRLYENYKNLNLWFTIMNTERGIHNGSGTASTDDFLNDTTTTKFIITKEKPFEKTFAGKISETNTEIIIEIPELNFKDGLPKSDFDENTRVRIHGFCDPINPEFAASLEEYIEHKDIKIITK